MPYNSNWLGYDLACLKITSRNKIKKNQVGSLIKSDQKGIRESKMSQRRSFVTLTVNPEKAKSQRVKRHKEDNL